MANFIIRNWQQVALNYSWHGAVRLGGTGNQVAVNWNLDGRLELFCIGDDQRIYQDWQTSPNGKWHGLIVFDKGAARARQLRLARNSDGRLQLFYIGLDWNIYSHAHAAVRSGAWVYVPMKGSAKQLVVGENRNGPLEIFYIGQDDKLRYNRQKQGDASAWEAETLIGTTAKQLAISSDRGYRLEVFYVGGTNKIYRAFQTRALSGRWEVEAIKGFATSISVARNADGRLEIFYTDTDGNIYHNWENAVGGGWHGETRFPQAAPGDVNGEIEVARNKDGRLELFYIATEKARNKPVIKHSWQISPSSNSWGYYADGAEARHLTAFTDSFDQINLFYTGDIA